jgi:hypothetical protein
VLARFLARLCESATPTIDLNRLLAHFPHRLLFEKRATGILNAAQINALAEGIRSLCGPHIDHLYNVWKQFGIDGLRAEWATRQEASNPPQINFTASVLKYDYDLFGILDAAS